MVKTWHVLFTLLCFSKVSHSITESEITSSKPASLTDATTSCSKGWFTFGDLCYRLGGKKKIGKLSWEKASERCQEEQNGYLAAIHSKELGDFLTAFMLLSVRESVWIGLHDRDNESLYSWEDGSSVNYTNWDPWEPSGEKYEKEDCTEMCFRYIPDGERTGQWNDAECHIEKQFICQKGKVKVSKKYSDPRFCSPELGGGWSHETSCFNFVPEEKTWSEAEEYCIENFKGHLVTIPDIAVNLFLSYILRDQEGEMWIGFRIEDAHRKKWSSGWQVSYENFSKSVEEFNEGSCAARDHEGKWLTLPCNDMHPFVCEYSTATPPTLKPPKLEGSSCPDKPAGWRDLDGDYCYYVDTTKHFTWHEANFLCMRRGGTLLSLHSLEETDILHNFIRYTYNEIYIGLYRHMQHDEEFVWADGSSRDFTFWQSNEPSTEKEQCVEMKTTNLKWNDIDCKQLRGYICSVPKAFPNQTNSQHGPSSSCLNGFNSITLIGVIFCVLFVAALIGVVLYYFRLCERGNERNKKNSGTKLPSPPASNFKPKYRSELVVTDGDLYENMI